VPKRIAGRVGEPAMTDDGIAVIASLEDLFATKVKVVLRPSTVAPTSLQNPLKR